ncbi:hypothetical protein THAOC_27140, partial [Thalassiosira oceanica]
RRAAPAGRGPRREEAAARRAERTRRPPRGRAASGRGAGRDRTVSPPLGGRVGEATRRGLGALLTAYPEAVSVPDGRTALYPFMLAASAGGERGGDASTIYRLLRASPGVCHMALDAPPPPLAPCGVPEEEAIAD